MNPIITIATPCFGGMVTQKYMMSVLKLKDYAADAGFEVNVNLLGKDALVSRARSTLLATFMDDSRASHILFIDADIGFEPEQVQRLLDFDKDFTGAFYPAKVHDWPRMMERHLKGGETLEQAATVYVGTLCTPPEFRTEGDFATAVYVGGGFQLIRREAVRRLMEAHPELHFKATHDFNNTSAQSPHLYALFDCLIDPATGVYLSEDYAFCQRWRTLGGEIWLDLASRLTHTGPHEFPGAYESRLRTFLKQTAG